MNERKFAETGCSLTNKKKIHRCLYNRWWQNNYKNQTLLDKTVVMSGW